MVPSERAFAAREGTKRESKQPRFDWEDGGASIESSSIKENGQGVQDHSHGNSPAKCRAREKKSAQTIVMDSD